MPGSFHGIETASSALRAFQRGLDTTGHNISNVSTPGYSRQVVDLSANDPISFVQGKMLSVGTGVHVSEINRVRDMFLDNRKLDAQGDLGKLGTSNDGLKQVQSVFLDADGKGVSNSLTALFNAWSALSSNPSDPSSKMQVQQAGADLTAKVRGTYSSLQTLKTQNLTAAGQTIASAQSLTNKIGELNDQIRQLKAAGGSPNDLMDQRDQAVSDLGQLLPVRTSNFSDGSVGVYMDQLTLADQDGARTIPTNFDAATSTMSDANGTYSVTSGSLKGAFDNVNAIGAYQAKLDTFANNLRTVVNGLHQTGTNSLGNTNVKFFNDVTSGPQDGAYNFALDKKVADDYNAIATGTSTAASDNSIALAISKARDTPVAGLGNQTVGSYYTTMLTDIGRAVQSSTSSLDTQTSMVSQIDKQISNVSGVSIDDEMANMLKFQRSYQAAAKALTIFDETLQNLIGMLNR